MKKKYFLYTALIFSIILEILLIYSFIVNKINKKEFILIGLANIGVMYVFVLNIKYINKLTRDK